MDGVDTDGIHAGIGQNLLRQRSRLGPYLTMWRQQQNRACKYGGTLRATDIGDGCVEFQMGWVTWCVVLVLWWNLPLHARERSANEGSALPWVQLDALSATRDKPLFAPSRQKASLPPPALPQTAPTEEAQQSRKPQFVLTGIITSSSQRIALLRDGRTSESLTVHSGETIGRWRVLSVTDHSVKLQDDSGQFELEMFDEP
jgi:general secretion pathway protein N